MFDVLESAHRYAKMELPKSFWVFYFPLQAWSRNVTKAAERPLFL